MSRKEFIHIYLCLLLYQALIEISFNQMCYFIPVVCKYLSSPNSCTESLLPSEAEVGGGNLWGRFQGKCSYKKVFSLFCHRKSSPSSLGTQSTSTSVSDSLASRPVRIHSFYNHPCGCFGLAVQMAKAKLFVLFYD